MEIAAFVVSIFAILISLAAVVYGRREAIAAEAADRWRAGRPWLTYNDGNAIQVVNNMEHAAYDVKAIAWVESEFGDGSPAAPVLQPGTALEVRRVFPVEEMPGPVLVRWKDDPSDPSWREWSTVVPFGVGRPY